MSFNISRIKMIFVGMIIIFISIGIYRKTISNRQPDIDPNGQLTLHTSEFPKSFNAFVNNSSDASAVFDLVYATLLEMDYNTLEYKPLIAESWTISPDKKEFTFKLNPDAKWSDGKPITAHDIKFTYDLIMDPQNMTSVMRLYYSRLNPPEVIDDYTVKMTVKTVHFKNFEMVAGFNVLPKHLMEGKDFNKDFNMSLPGGSGPYDLTEVKEGRYYVLSRKKDYWADRLPHRHQTYNFGKIKYKVMDRNLAFEAFKKGEFDFYDEIMPKRWVTETNSEHFTNNWIVKQKIYNYAPRGFLGLAFNMRKPLFQDLRVRKAIALLLDRKTILNKIYYDLYKPLNSYFPSLYGPNEKQPPFLDYNIDQARELLKQAGYDRMDNTGYLIDRNGRRLEFTIIYAIEDYEKDLTIFKESCKKAGVNLILKRLSWATLIKEMDQYNFDMVRIGWTGVLFPDPEQLWHSKHISERGGSNLPGFKNDEIDGYIDSLPANFDVQSRIQILKKMDRTIAKEIPYVLLWERDYSWLFYKNIFGKPKTVTQKYTLGIIKYWWIDPVKVKKYQEAVKLKKALPKEPEEIHYDEMLKK